MFIVVVVVVTLSLPLLLYLCDCEWCPLAAPIISYIKGQRWHLKDADVFFSQQRVVNEFPPVAASMEPGR